VNYICVQLLDENDKLLPFVNKIYLKLKYARKLKAVGNGNPFGTTPFYG
jgi:hypothetical protein